MKILILGMLGAGKSTLAYNLNKDYGLSRLNLDEVSRDKTTGGYFSEKEQFDKIDKFLSDNSSWVMEGIQKKLFKRVNPDIIVYIKISRLKAVWRFTTRFFKAKKLIGKEIDTDLPVQAYHYRKPTIAKICDWDRCNKNIRKDIEEYLEGRKYFLFRGGEDISKLENIIKNSLI